MVIAHIRYYILEQDVTTAGGIVQTTSNINFVTYNGRQISYIGDEVWCSACQSMGIIGPDGPRHQTIVNSHKPALNGDLCLCRCNPSPRLINSQTTFLEMVGSSNQANSNGSLTRHNIVNNFATKDPNKMNAFNEARCPDECIVDVIEFNTNPGPYVISKLMWKKIIEFEKYSEAPYQPGDKDSGVTVAIGYDLGQQSRENIKKDLNGFYSEEQIRRLLLAQGKKGDEAKAMVHQFRDIRISYEQATELAIRLKTRYAQDTLSIYPQALNLHPHCQGVLLSLVFNRGKRLSDSPNGLTRIHMRQIQETLQNGKPENIPNILRDMSKLWSKTGPNGNSGVGKRRREEADIFEKGVKCDCYQ